MKFVIFASVVLAVFLQGIHFSSAAEACNDYVDEAMQDMKDNDYFQRETKLPPTAFEFAKKIAFIEYTGGVKIDDIVLHGLDELHRDGNSMVHKRGKRIVMETEIAAKDVKMTGTAKIQFMGQGPKVDIEATVSHLEFTVMSTHVAGSNPKINSIKVEKAQGMNVQLKGLLSSLNFLSHYFDTHMNELFAKAAARNMETQIRSFLKERPKDYVIPDECISTA